MSIGEIAYNAYCSKRGWKSVRGETLPQFEAQAEDLQAAWQAAAMAVVDCQAHQDYALLTHMEQQELTNERDRLRDAVIRWGQHDADCVSAGSAWCTCGLGAALKGEAQ